MTICVRTMALTFTNPVDAAFAYSLFFGTLLPVATIIIITINSSVIQLPESITITITINSSIIQLPEYAISVKILSSSVCN